MKQDKLFTEKFLEELQKWEDFIPQEFFSWLFKHLGLAHRTIILNIIPTTRETVFTREIFR